MAEQYIVAVFLDGTLNVDACGPYRSEAKAQAISDRLNETADWSDAAELASLIAQVVRLRPEAELHAAMSDPEPTDSEKN